MIWLILLIHAAIAFAGARSIWKRRKIGNLALFLLLTGFSAYAGAARLADLPFPNLIKGSDIVFQPMGVWIERQLGGPVE